MQLQDLPRVPLTDIFRFLGIRDRVRIESVCNESRWRDAIRHAWNDCKDIILDDLISVDNEGLSAQAKADAFRAVFKGFGPYIKFLQIKNKIGVLNFVGRYFHLIKQLTHLSIIQPMNYFNVTLIEEHLSHLLVGLQLVLINQLLETFKCTLAENEFLEINSINLFFEEIDRILTQSGSRSKATFRFVVRLFLLAYRK
uniref:F-box domain-containing protein n=1 Tax=Meloidogyne hapla TaxID=6305 RepID=A0A1I8B3Q0_MELHA